MNGVAACFPIGQADRAGWQISRENQGILKPNLQRGARPGASWTDLFNKKQRREAAPLLLTGGLISGNADRQRCAASRRPHQIRVADDRRCSVEAPGRNGQECAWFDHNQQGDPGSHRRPEPHRAEVVFHWFVRDHVREHPRVDHPARTRPVCRDLSRVSSY
jgi:hypothetical protein